jgi:hypothetical protein
MAALHEIQSYQFRRGELMFAADPMQEEWWT